LKTKNFLRTDFSSTDFGDGHAKEEGREERRKERGEKVNFQNF